MLERYLQDLDREFAQRLPEDDAQSRSAEAERHLRAEVESLIALGLDPTTATREAVASYGVAEAVARTAERQALAPRERARAAMLAFAFACGLLGLLGGVPDWPFGVALLALIPVAFAARRPATRRVVAMGVATTLAAVVLVPSVYLDLSAGRMPRSEASGEAGRLTRLAAGLDADKARFDRFEGDWESLRRPGGYLAPAFAGERLAWRVLPTRDAADDAWTAVADHHDHLESSAAANRAEEIGWALAHPVRTALASVVPTVAGGIVLTLSLFLTDGFFGLLGAFAFALRRRPRLRSLAPPEGDPRLRPTVDALERELSRGLPTAEAALRTAEAQAHLEEGVGARKEMGMGPDEAARDAVLAFGPVRRVAREMIRQGLASLSAARSRVLIGLCAAYALSTFFVLLPGAETPSCVAAFVLALLAGLGALAVAAFRARRLALPATLASTVGAVVGIWLLGAATTVYVPIDGRLTIVPRWAVADQMQALQTVIDNRRATRKAFVRDWAAFQKEGIDAFRDASYRIPTFRCPFVGIDGTLVYTTANRKDAIESWDDVRKGLAKSTDTRELEKRMADVRRPLEDPSVNLAANVPAVFLNNVPFVLLVSVTDLAFAGLGSLAFALRRRRPAHA